MGLQKGLKSDFSHFFFRNQNYQFSHFRRTFFIIDVCIWNFLQWSPILAPFECNVFSFSSGELLIWQSLNIEYYKIFVLILLIISSNCSKLRKKTLTNKTFLFSVEKKKSKQILHSIQYSTFKLQQISKSPDEMLRT